MGALIEPAPRSLLLLILTNDDFGEHDWGSEHLDLNGHRLARPRHDARPCGRNYALPANLPFEFNACIRYISSVNLAVPS